MVLERLTTPGKLVGQPDTAMNEQLLTLVSSAMLAPSGDNMQPWHFVIDEAGTSITVYVDETRDTSPMNAGQRMSRLACGAAIENIVQTAEHNGWEIAIDAHNDSSRVATVQMIRSSSQCGEIPDFISRRHTNRRLYDGATLPASVTSPWKDMALSDEDVEIIWVTDRSLLRELAIAIGRADAEMFGRAAFFRAFVSNVRFDLPPCVAADEGLCVGSLELTAFERRVLPMLRHAPDILLRSWPMRLSFQTKAKRLVNSSSGMCLIVPGKAEATTNFRIGRVMQRAWLHLTKAGYQVQPMMSIPVLYSANPAAIISCEEITKFLSSSTNQLVPAAILRFGHGPPCSARCGRRTSPSPFAKSIAPANDKARAPTCGARANSSFHQTEN